MPNTHIHESSTNCDNHFNYKKEQYGFSKLTTYKFHHQKNVTHEKGTLYK